MHAEELHDNHSGNLLGALRDLGIVHFDLNEYGPAVDEFDAAFQAMPTLAVIVRATSACSMGAERPRRQATRSDVGCTRPIARSAWMKFALRQCLEDLVEGPRVLELRFDPGRLLDSMSGPPGRAPPATAVNSLERR